MKERAIFFCFLVIAGAGALSGQSVEIYSEFQRVDPSGKIVGVDAAEHPREVLSPAVVRNSFASFHVVVTAPRESGYLLYVATNPLNACRVYLYKEHFVKTAAGWIPDSLVEVRHLPDFGAMPDPDENIPEQTTRVYLLDLWIPPGATPGGFRLEVQLRVGYWVVRPLEVRVLAARIPDLRVAPDAEQSRPLPRVDERADAATLAPVAAYTAGAALTSYVQPRTVRGIIRRNAIEDMALAGLVNPARAGPEAIRKFQAALPRGAGAEGYLRLRDLILSEAQCVLW